MDSPASVRNGDSSSPGAAGTSTRKVRATGALPAYDARAVSVTWVAVASGRVTTADEPCTEITAGSDDSQLTSLPDRPLSGSVRVLTAVVGTVRASRSDCATVAGSKPGLCTWVRATTSRVLATAS